MSFMDNIDDIMIADAFKRLSNRIDHVVCWNDRGRMRLLDGYVVCVASTGVDVVSTAGGGSDTDSTATRT